MVKMNAVNVDVIQVRLPYYYMLFVGTDVDPRKQ